ncbi:Short-chain dehydrogenase/reductase family protein [Mycena venus]|uniref:Short-chain dehydrogenase/reductase family protein n=1 Tax=Mycena venus TaxID=2733690 RepID=A0A8H6YP15_9AGAR|nr:Short-chain dehydrogenase/reductase family protein [Mycena venus]
MALSDILFSPIARVWNLRLLLLETLVTWVFLAIRLSSVIDHYGVEAASKPIVYLPWYILFPTFGFILLHHVGFVFDCFDLAITDLIFVFIQVGGIGAGFVIANTGMWLEKGLFPSPIKFAYIPLGLSLTISIMFRVATIMRSNRPRGGFLCQRFAFLGECTPINPPYTPITIFLNRSIARPLVRGESAIIIMARGLVLSCMALGVPMFGIYAIIISPLQAPVYTRSVPSFEAGNLTSPPGNVTFLMEYFSFKDSEPPRDPSANHVAVQNQNFELDYFYCPVTFATGTERLVECPLSWSSVRSVSISIDTSPGSVVTVTPLQGRRGIEPIQQLASEFPSLRLQVATDATPMVSGSNLFGRLTWTQRETLSPWGLASPAASKPVFTADITGLQPYLLDTTSAAQNFATLLLYQPYTNATQLTHDVSDVSALSGLSTFGGFWTFVNGAFALLFGANVIYFAFGRRPLSALGLVHIFQKSKLVRRWHTDFFPHCAPREAYLDLSRPGLLPSSVKGS